MNTVTIKLPVNPTSKEIRKALMYEPPSTHVLTNIREGEHGLYLTFTEPEEAPMVQRTKRFNNIEREAAISTGEEEEYPKCSIVYCPDNAEWRDQDGTPYCTWHATHQPAGSTFTAV